MHDSARDYVYNEFHLWRGKQTTEQSGYNEHDALEIGSLDINGGVRSIFEPFCRSYVGIDIQEGFGVDEIADAAAFLRIDSFDIVVCCEVFEHTPHWKKIIENTMNNLRPGGIFITTMAGEGRRPHSAIDEQPIREWEHYSNIGEWELNQTLKGFFTESVTNVSGTDLRAWAIK